MLQDRMELMRCRYLSAYLKDNNCGIGICQKILAEKMRAVHLIAITVGHAADFELIMYAICGEKGPLPHKSVYCYGELGRKLCMLTHP